MQTRRSPNANSGMMNARAMLAAVLSGLLFVFSLGFAISTAVRLRTISARIERKRQETAAMRRLASRVEEWKAAVASAEAEARWTGASLDALLREMFPAASSDSIRQNVRKLPNGWSLHEAEASLRGVSFEVATDFARRAEAPERGWRVAGLSYVAEYGAVGAGNAVIRFEALERCGTSPGSTTGGADVH